MIDCRSRELKVWMASATQTNNFQLVLRHALEMGTLKDLLAKSEKVEFNRFGKKPVRIIRSSWPVIALGNYQAMSSAGHAWVKGAVPSADSPRSPRCLLVVGGLGRGAFGGKGLRVLSRPIEGQLVAGPTAIDELESFSNSNWTATEAAAAAIDLLTEIDKESIFIEEGQSDRAYVARIRSSAETSTTFPAEHRQEMFSQENILRRMFKSAAYREARGGEEEAPPDWAVRAACRRLAGQYIKAVEKDRCSQLLGYWPGYWPEAARLAVATGYAEENPSEGSEG